MIESAVIHAVGSPNHHSQLVSNRPRAMLPVLGKPLVVRIMDLLYRAGIRRFIVVVGEDEGAVAAYLGTQWLPNVQVEFAIQASSESLTKALSDVARRQSQPFLFAGYNAFIHANFPERLIKHFREFGDGLVLGAAPITLSSSARWSAQVEGQAVREIRTEGGSGVYLLTDLAVCGSEFVRYVGARRPGTGTFARHFMEIARAYLQAGGRTLFAETSWTLQIESDRDYLTLNKYLLDEGQDCHILSEIPGTVRIVPPVRIDPRVSIGQDARIGPRVYLEAGCRVGAEAALSDSIVLQNATVPAGKKISNAIVSAHAQLDYAKRG